jgi:hypothetical protein
MEMKELRARLKISEAHLSDELADHAAMLMFAGEVMVKADSDFQNYQLQVNELIATLDGLIRSKAIEDGKKLTEKAITSEIELSNDYRSAQRMLLKLKSQRDLAKFLREAWEKRGSMVTQLAAKQRSESEALRFGEMKGTGTEG